MILRQGTYNMNEENKDEDKKLSLDSPEFKRMDAELNIQLDAMNRHENDSAREIGEAILEAIDGMVKPEIDAWVEQQSGVIREDFDFFVDMAKFAKDYPEEFVRLRRLKRERIEMLLNLPERLKKIIGAKYTFALPGGKKEKSLANYSEDEIEALRDSMAFDDEKSALWVAFIKDKMKKLMWEVEEAEMDTGRLSEAEWGKLEKMMEEFQTMVGNIIEKGKNK